jgi:putative addiction module killer protein
MIELKQTQTYEKWESRLRDKRAKTIIASRLMRLAEGLHGDVEPVGEGISELRIPLWSWLPYLLSATRKPDSCTTLRRR